ncbi:hypothetical protein M8818_002975 [Zalaria obscura]|uniref:Uncharacterized protein n=1 Tax=Zalaria obscura TaxID=2024903 RepID=A0ACC3SFJ8_9PEZI
MSRTPVALCAYASLERDVESAAAARTLGVHAFSLVLAALPRQSRSQKSAAFKLTCLLKPGSGAAHDSWPDRGAYQAPAISHHTVTCAWLGCTRHTVIANRHARVRHLESRAAITYLQGLQAWNVT